MILRSPTNRKILVAISTASLSFGMICCNLPGSSSSSSPAAPISGALHQARNDYSGTWTCTGSTCDKNEVFQITDDFKTLKFFTTKTLTTGVDCDIEQDDAIQSKAVRGKPPLLNLIVVPGKFQLVTEEMDPNPNPSAVPSSTPSASPSETPASEASECQAAVTAANADLGAKPASMTFVSSLDSTKQILSMGYTASSEKQYTKKK